MSDAAYSSMLLNAVAGLATRLAVDGLAIYTLRYDYPVFGNWEIVAGRRRSRVRIVWDGKAAILSVCVAHLSSPADQPQWRPVSEKDFSKRRGEHAEIFAATYTAIRQHSDV